MSIYMGEEGGVSIRRFGAAALGTTLDPDDVVVADRRFSADFATGAIITGARLEIGTQDQTSNLELVAGHDFPDGYWYCHVDDTGGIRLYDNFQDAVNGGKLNALELVQPSSAQEIYVHTKDEDFNGTAQVRNWTITTNRESIDLTVLGNQHRDQYANGLISGQGELNCLWEYRYGECTEPDNTGCELPHYYAQLLLRLTQGSNFDGKFYIYSGNEDNSVPAVWYEATCVVTNISFAFAPGQPITTAVQFVTTGPVSLHTGYRTDFVTQEDLGLILQENDGGIELEVPA